MSLEFPGISAWLAGRLARRIAWVESYLSSIAHGEFEVSGPAPPVTGEGLPDEVEPEEPYDELDALANSAAMLTFQLVELQEEIRHTEQVRLLAQLAGGLAHQLRNAVTGARLAIQLHDRRCDLADDESLSVALRQLALTEQQIRSLLSLGRKELREAEAARVEDLITELDQLVTPHAKHAHVDLTVNSQAGEAIVSDAESFRLATLNLALNAIEATGSDGSVSVDCFLKDESVCVEVRDSGDGPPPEIGDSLFEPFVTSRPEGVGLGLVLVRQTADRTGGSVTWAREESQTVFRLAIPATVEKKISVPSPLGGEGVRRADEGAEQSPADSETSPAAEPVSTDALEGQS